METASRSWRSTSAFCLPGLILFAITRRVASLSISYTKNHQIALTWSNLRRIFSPCAFLSLTQIRRKDHSCCFGPAQSFFTPLHKTALGRFASFSRWVSHRNIMSKQLQLGPDGSEWRTFFGSDPAITTSEACDGSCAGACGCRLPSHYRVHNFDCVQITMFSETSHEMTKVKKEAQLMS